MSFSRSESKIKRKLERKARRKQYKKEQLAASVRNDAVDIIENVENSMKIKEQNVAANIESEPVIILKKDLNEETVSDFKW